MGMHLAWESTCFIAFIVGGTYKKDTPRPGGLHNRYTVFDSSQTKVWISIEDLTVSLWSQPFQKNTDEMHQSHPKCNILTTCDQIKMKETPAFRRSGHFFRLRVAEAFKTEDLFRAQSVILVLQKWPWFLKWEMQSGDNHSILGFWIGTVICPVVKWPESTAFAECLEMASQPAVSSLQGSGRSGWV